MHTFEYYRDQADSTQVKGVLDYKFKEDFPEEITNMLTSVSKIFTVILKEKRPDLMAYAPYEIRVQSLVAKNEWTKGTYIAINQNDGTLDLHLNKERVVEICTEVDQPDPEKAFVWLFFHEFRHKIQNDSEVLQSLINHSNWTNFNEFMQKEFNKDKDKIDHIFHELNPAEVDAHAFACEMTQLKFQGTVFDIVDDKLAMLKQ